MSPRKDRMTGTPESKRQRSRAWPVAHDRYGERHLRAVLRSNGELVLEGQDLGRDLPFAGLSGVTEYEYAHTIPAEEVPRLVEVLGGGPSDDVLHLLIASFPEGAMTNFSEFFKEHGIKAGIWNHFDAD
jgi:hypothetical protein